MIKFLKIAGIVIGILILIVVAIVMYMVYRGEHIKDTHDLQAQVDEYCENYLSEDKGVGLFVGIIQNGKVYWKGYGVTDKESAIAPDSNTIFEIGSISKVFTTEIAQQLVEQGQLNWNDNILQYLPEQARPAQDDTTTLMHLASHTAGYPRLPESWFPKIEANECDPYSSLTIEDVYNTVHNAEKKERPSMEDSYYSNLGMGLLGHSMEWKTGKSYEQLLQEYICTPLSMNNTSTYWDSSWVSATGYDDSGRKTCYWTLPVLQGAGAIKSNGADMLRYLQANMGGDSELYKSFAATQQQLVKTGNGGVGYGWHIDVISGLFSGIEKIVWHNGGTGGFRSYMGFIPDRNTGIIVLSNRSHNDFDRLAVKIICKAGNISLQ